MARNLIVNGVTYNDVEALEMTDEDGEKVLYTEGGTGGGSATAVSVVLTVEGWEEVASRRFAQTVAVEGVTTDESQVIHVDVALTGVDLNADSEILAAWGNAEGKGPASQNVKQGDGTLTFYCLEVPAVNIPLNVGVG